MAETNESRGSRTRWIGVGAAAALICAGTAAGAPRMLGLSDAEPAPAATAAGAQAERDGTGGWPFPQQTETDRITSSRVNDEGASEFEWTTRLKVPSDAMHLVFCRRSERLEPGESRVRVMLTINGRETTEGWACPYRKAYPPVHGSLVVQDLTPHFDQYYDVAPGEPFTVRMWLERAGEPVDAPGTSFGVAFARCEEPPEDGHSGFAGRPGCQTLTFPGPGSGVMDLGQAPAASGPLMQHFAGASYLSK